MYVFNDWIYFGIITAVVTVSFFHNGSRTFNQVINGQAAQTRAEGLVGEWFAQKVRAVVLPADSANCFILEAY